VKFGQLVDIDVGDAVAIGEVERFVVVEPLFEAFETASGLGIEASVNDVYFPGEVLAIVDRDIPVGEVNADIAGAGIKIKEILFDHFGFVAGGN